MSMAKIMIVLMVLAGGLVEAKTLPTNAQLISLKNNTVLKEHDMRGNIYVMDFWATWCESCRKNLVTLDAVMRKKNSSASFVFVSLDEEGLDIVRSFFEIPELKRTLTWIKPRTYWDKNQILGKQLAKNGIPYLAAISTNGKVLFEHDGILQDSDLRKLNAILAKNEVKQR